MNGFNATLHLMVAKVLWLTADAIDEQYGHPNGIPCDQALQIARQVAIQHNIPDLETVLARVNQAIEAGYREEQKRS